MKSIKITTTQKILCALIIIAIVIIFQKMGREIGPIFGALSMITCIALTVNK